MQRLLPARRFIESSRECRDLDDEKADADESNDGKRTK